MKVEELDAEGKKEGQERERGKGERSEQEVSYIIHVVMEQLLRSLDDSFFAVYAPLFSPSLSCLLPYPTSDSLYLSSPFLLLLLLLSYNFNLLPPSLILLILLQDLHRMGIEKQILSLLDELTTIMLHLTCKYFSKRLRSSYSSSLAIKKKVDLDMLMRYPDTFLLFSFISYHIISNHIGLSGLLFFLFLTL